MPDHQKKYTLSNLIERLVRRIQKKPIDIANDDYFFSQADYHITNSIEGLYVTLSRDDTILGKFLQTYSGTWFMLSESGTFAPFEDDIQLNSSDEIVKYLSGIIETPES